MKRKQVCFLKSMNKEKGEQKKEKQKGTQRGECREKITKVREISKQQKETHQQHQTYKYKHENPGLFLCVSSWHWSGGMGSFNSWA